MLKTILHQTITNSEQINKCFTKVIIRTRFHRQRAYVVVAIVVVVAITGNLKKALNEVS